MYFIRIDEFFRAFEREFSAPRSKTFLNEIEEVSMLLRYLESHRKLLFTHFFAFSPDSLPEGGCKKSRHDLSSGGGEERRIKAIHT